MLRRGRTAGARRAQSRALQVRPADECFRLAWRPAGPQNNNAYAAVIARGARCAHEPGIADVTSGVVFALAIALLLVAIIGGLIKRSRSAGRGARGGMEGPNTVAQWTEGETTRLLSSAELPGLYLLRPRFLSKAESVVYLLLKAAFPRHEIFARIRLADVLQVKIGPQGMERLRAFRKIANQHVGFVVCDRDMTIVAIVDSKEPDQVINPRDQKLEIIKQRCLQAAQVKYICVYPPQLPRYRELREQILGPAAELM
jgi:hypothetical protein